MFETLMKSVKRMATSMTEDKPEPLTMYDIEMDEFLEKVFLQTLDRLIQRGHGDPVNYAVEITNEVNNLRT